MQHFFVTPDALKGNKIYITGPDVNHIRNVLRMKPGDKIDVSDGESQHYMCEIESIADNEVLAEVLTAGPFENELSTGLILFQSLPKGDKMDTVIQKAVELGAREIVPVRSGRCVVRLDEKRAALKCERWNKIAESSAKQCQRGIIPKVRDVIDFKDALSLIPSFDLCLIPYEGERDMAKTKEILKDLPKSGNIGIFIGPEGGWEEDEVSLAQKAGAFSITLGKRILRTETAGAAALSVLMFLLEE